MVRLLDRMQELAGADELLAAALDQARQLPDTEQYRLMLLCLVVARLCTARQQDVERAGLVAEALTLYEGMPLRAINSVPGLSRDLAAEAGPHSTKLLGAAPRVVGLPNQSAGEAQELGEMLVRIDNSVPSSIMPVDFDGTGEPEAYSSWVEEQNRHHDVLVSVHYQSESDVAYYETDRERQRADRGARRAVRIQVRVAAADGMSPGQFRRAVSTAA